MVTYNQIKNLAAHLLNETFFLFKMILRIDNVRIQVRDGQTGRLGDSRRAFSVLYGEIERNISPRKAFSSQFGPVTISKIVSV